MRLYMSYIFRYLRIFTTTTARGDPRGTSLIPEVSDFITVGCRRDLRGYVTVCVVTKPGVLFDFAFGIRNQRENEVDDILDNLLFTY